MSAFAAVVAGRAPQSFTAVEATQHTLTIPDVQSVNHLVVFLTAPLPAGTAGVVHLHFPGTQTWKVLGLCVDQDRALRVDRSGCTLIDHRRSMR